MDKDKEIERLKKQLSAKDEKIKSLKKEVREAKRQRRLASKKKDVRTVTLSEEQERLLSSLLKDIDSLS